MSSRRHTPEQIINKLRQAEVEIANGATIGQAAKKIGVTDQTYLSLLRTCAETDFRGWNTRTHGHVAIIRSSGDGGARLGICSVHDRTAVTTPSSV